jgi:hypothetical protein
LEIWYARSDTVIATPSAVQEDERIAFTDDLVAELYLVDSRNAGCIRRRRHIVLPVAGAPWSSVLESRGDGRFVNTDRSRMPTPVTP